MDLLYEIKYSLMTIFPPSIFDIFDIALLAYIIYQIIKFMLENRAIGLFKGLAVLVCAYLVAKIAHMKAITFIFENAFNIGLIALVILFQPELRRSIEEVGHNILTQFDKLHRTDEPEIIEMWKQPIEEICSACASLSATSTGALIVIERTGRLGDQLKTGTAVNADISQQLIGNIFFNKAPLHDGAMIIRDGRILACGCHLPSTSKPEIVNKNLGHRHMAAIGMSENSDAITIVVSEETGVISVAEYGKLNRQLSADDLKTILTDKLINEKLKKENKENGTDTSSDDKPSEKNSDNGGKEDK